MNEDSPVTKSKIPTLINRVDGAQGAVPVTQKASQPMEDAADLSRWAWNVRMAPSIFLSISAILSYLSNQVSACDDCDPGEKASPPPKIDVSMPSPG